MQKLYNKKDPEFLRKLKIRDLSFNDASAILELVYSVFGNNYIDKEFYDINVIKDYLKRIVENVEGIWKGVFLYDRLIGMMLAIVENNIGILKMTMVRKKYINKGVISKLSIEMIKDVYRFKKFKINCIYAFVDNNNFSMLRIVNKFGFIKLGNTPFFENKKYYYIYGKIFFNSNFYLISPHHKIYQHLETTIKETEINRKVIKNKLLLSILINNANSNLKINQIECQFPKIYHVLDKNTICAKFLENEYNRSWYNIEIFDYVSLDLKAKIVSKIIKLFYKKKQINSLSIAIDINDVILQEIFLNSNFKYYAFLPFYFPNKDAVLLGLSKIKNENIEVKK